MTEPRDHRIEITDLEELEVAEWIHFVREWREALADSDPAPAAKEA